MDPDDISTIVDGTISWAEEGVAVDCIPDFAGKLQKGKWMGGDWGRGVW